MEGIGNNEDAIKFMNEEFKSNPECVATSANQKYAANPLGRVE